MKFKRAKSFGSRAQVKKNRYVLTKNPDFKLSEGLEDNIICTDYMELVKRYKDSEDELLIMGGLPIL